MLSYDAEHGKHYVNIITEALAWLYTLRFVSTVNSVIEIYLEERTQVSFFTVTLVEI